MRSTDWGESLAVRDYEWIGYSLAALAGGAWGAMSIGLLFQYPPTSTFSYLVLWPAWIDLSVLRAPGVLQSALIGGLITSALLYVLFTVGHLREAKP